MDDAVDESRAGSGERAGGTVREAAAPQGYYRVTRSLSAGFIALLPLLAIYELGILGLGRDINAVAGLVKTPLAWLEGRPTELLGTDPVLVLNALLIVATLVAVWRLGRRGGLNPGTFGGMLIESSVYAVLLGTLTLLILYRRLDAHGISPNFDNFLLKLVASCGAGLYEELIFRGLVLWAIYTVAKDGARLRPFTAGVVGLLFSGAIFSAAHFLSPGEPIDYGAFLYRLFAGMFLGIVFLTRGIGIAAWTHALYDIYVLCLTSA